MVVEVEERHQWRVPPIHHNLTVDIFSEPEYFQVGKLNSYILYRRQRGTVFTYRET